jgi:class 3 adenylate cyclase
MENPGTTRHCAIDHAGENTMPNEDTSSGAPPPLARKLATILCADVAGYSQMMAVNEDRTVQVFRGHREIFESLVRLHRGRIFNTAGDALLAEFNSAVEAVRCATEIQSALGTRNEPLAPEEKMLFRMGINLGDVIVQGDDLLGDGVNVAARIQTSTEPGGICISGSVYDQIQNKLSLSFKLLGEQTYKNIARSVRTYTINEGAAVTAPAPRRSLKMPAAIAAAVLVILGAGYWGYRQYDTQRAQQVRIESQMAAQLATQKQATEQAQRDAEDARRDAQVQAQRQTAEDTLRRAREERNRLEQDRKLLETEKRAAEAAKKQAEASQRTTPAAAPVAPKSAAPYDGTYNGRLCNHLKDDVKPNCWSVALFVRNGIAEATWLSATQKTSTANGAVAANGALELKLAGWTREGNPTDAVLVGRVGDDAITVSGQWRNGSAVAGSWRRQGAAATPAATIAPKSAAPYDGTYYGRLCNHLKNDVPPNCWGVALFVRNGIAEGAWFSGSSQKTSTANGAIAANGALELKLVGWTREGHLAEAVLVGRVAADAITVSGQWRGGSAVAGNWTRTQ